MILVISPTISLMMDQVQNLPKKIRGACLSSSDQAVILINQPSYFFLVDNEQSY